MATDKKDYQVTSRVRIDNEVRDIGSKVSLTDETAAPIRHCLQKATEAPAASKGGSKGEQSAEK